MPYIMYIDDKAMAKLKDEITDGAIRATITAGAGSTYASSVSANDLGAAIDAGKPVEIVYNGAPAASIAATKDGTTYTVTAVFQAVNSGATGLDISIFAITGTAATLTEKSLTFAV